MIKKEKKKPNTQRNTFLPQSNILVVIIWNNTSRNAGDDDCWLSREEKQGPS